MLTWMSRILIFVFVFNILSPDLLRAQQATASPVPTDLKEQIAAAVATKLSSAKSENELEKTYASQLAGLRKLYENFDVSDPVTAFLALEEIVSQMHQLSSRYALAKQKFIGAQIAQKNKEAWEFSQTPQGKIMTQDNTYVRMPDVLPYNLGNRFLERLSSDELSLEEIVETIDPVEMHPVEGMSANQRYTVFAPAANGLDQSAAAEVLYNTIGQALKQSALSAGEIAFWTDSLPKMQVRAYHALDKLEFSKDSEIIMARNTKRLLLYQIHKLYEKLGLDDPLTTDVVRTRTETPYAQPTRQTYEKYKKEIERQNKTRTEIQKTVLITPSYETYVSAHSLPASEQIPAGYEVKTVVRTEEKKKKNNALFEHFRKLFIQEMKQLKENAEPGSKEMALLKLQTEGAVRYMLLADYPGEITSMVRLLENDDKEAIINFQTDYGEVLETLFSTLVETGKLFPLSDTTIKSVQGQLLTLADFKQNNAFVTRTLAIASAGLLNVSDKWNAVQVTSEGYTHVTGTDYTQEEATQMKLAFGAVNNFKFSDKQRQLLAKYAVDIYASLGIYLPDMIPGHSGVTIINNLFGHGLDAEQIQSLQKELAVALDNFCPLPAFATKWKDEVGFVAGNRMIVNTIQGKTNTRILKGKTFQTPDPVFLPDMLDKPHAVFFDPSINEMRAFDEKASIFVDLLFESALWILGGEVIIFLPRILTKVGGFFVQIPKAVKVFNTAAKGERLSAAWQTTVKGYRYASTNARAAHIGATVTTTRVENTITRGEKLARATREAEAAASRAQKATRYAEETAKVADESTQAAEIAAKARQSAQEATQLAEETAQELEKAQAAVKDFGAQSYIQAPVTRYGSSYYSPMARNLGTEGGAGWLRRIFTPRSEITSITVTQGDKTIVIGADKLAKMGIKNPKRLSVADKINLWEKEINPWLEQNPFHYKHPNWLHPFDLDRWASFRLGTGFGPAGSASAAAKETERAMRAAEELLKVRSGASLQEIKKAYATANKLYNPDILIHKSVSEVRPILEGALENMPKDWTTQRALLQKMLAEEAAEGETVSQVLEKVASRMSPSAREKLVAEYVQMHNLAGRTVPADLDLNQIMRGYLGWKQADINAAARLLKGETGVDLGSVVTTAKAPAANPSAWQKVKSTPKQLAEILASSLTDGDIWLAKSFWYNLRFFGLWTLGDLAVYPAQWYMMDKTLEQQLQREMDKHGAAFKSDPSDPKTNPYAKDASVSTVANVNSAKSQREAFRGSLIVAPVLATMIAGGKDFMEGQTATQLEINARKINLRRAQNKRINAHNQKKLDESIQTQAEALTAAFSQWQQLLKQDTQGLYTQEYKAILRALKEEEKSLRKIGHSQEDITKKWEQYNDWLNLPVLSQALKKYHQKWFDSQLDVLQEAINNPFITSQTRQEYEQAVAKLTAWRKEDNFKQANTFVAQLTQKLNALSFLDPQEITTLGDAYQTEALYEMAILVNDFWNSYAFLQGNKEAIEQVKQLVNANEEIVKSWELQEDAARDLYDRYESFLLNFSISLESIGEEYRQQLPIAEREAFDKQSGLTDLQRLFFSYQAKYPALKEEQQIAQQVEALRQQSTTALENIASNQTLSADQKRSAYVSLLLETDDQIEQLLSRLRPETTFPENMLEWDEENELFQPYSN